MASLRELQRSFAAALRDRRVACAVAPMANLDVYRNHEESQFLSVLGLSFPVVRRRVGDAYFRQLAHHYRLAHPSRSGDLQWLGRWYPEFLGVHLAGGEYAWLADLARLEWLRELAAIARPSPAIDAGALSKIAPEDLEHLRFRLQPSLALHESQFPVFSVWLSNQAPDAPPVDQSVGSEQGMVLARNDSVLILQLDRSRFDFLTAMLNGQSLGEAMTAAHLDEHALAHTLRFVFSEGLVCDLLQRSKR
jgi:hypothetical protein